MNAYNPEQISEIFTKVLQELNKTDVSKLSFEERLNLAQNPNATVEILQGLARDKASNVRSGFRKTLTRLWKFCRV